MNARAFPYVPGVPAAGHVTSGGAWHPGRIDGCVKCEPARTPTPRGAVRYPRVTVQLTGHDGNAFAILGRVQQALRRAGVDATETRAFVDEATAGDYDHLLGVVQQWVDVT